MSQCHYNVIGIVYEKYLKNKPITITIVGNKEKIDMEKLAKFGDVIELDKKDIFN